MPILRERVIWRRERPGPKVRRLADSLTPDEQANVKRAMRHLQLLYGSVKELALAVGVPYQTVRHVLSCARGPNAGVALRAARLAGVPIDDVVSGAWPPKRKRCPLCGRSW